MTEPAPIGGASSPALAYVREVARLCGSTEWDVAAVIDCLSHARLPLDDEKLLQVAMAEAFIAARIPFEREVQLSERDCLDFLIPGGIAVEVKIKGGRHAIYRQCARYCALPAVTALILATSLPMALPERIQDKPAFVVSLGEAWL